MILYRLLMLVVALREIASRALKRDFEGCKQRLGRTQPAQQKDHIWIHAASNGEVTSAKPVISQLGHDGRAILVTVNTESAVALVQGWALPNVSVQLAPIDLPGPTARLIKNWGVKALIVLESDLWPHRILTCPGPVLVLGARLTERSAKGWKRFNALARKVVGKISYLSAQDAGSLKRISQFGLAEAATGPVYDLKALYAPPKASPDATLLQAFDLQKTWLAASTHEGEDQIILSAHTKAQQTWPDLKLILAPRHPKRAEAIAKLANLLGLTVAQRSQNDAPDAGQIYLADTLGEMALWYQLAGITFVAGSLTDRGGHTPYEPAYFASAILHGPDTANFQAAYARLKDKNASIRVTDTDTLAEALISLNDPLRQQALGIAAQSALRQDTDIDALMTDIRGVLDA